jgi:hypothetical protein
MPTTSKQKDRKLGTSPFALKTKMSSSIIRSILFLGTGFICGNLYSDENKTRSLLVWFQNVFEKGIRNSFLKPSNPHDQLNEQQENLANKTETIITKNHDNEFRTRPSDGARQLLFDTNGRLKRRLFQ